MRLQRRIRSIGLIGVLLAIAGCATEDTGYRYPPGQEPAPSKPKWGQTNFLCDAMALPRDRLTRPPIGFNLPYKDGRIHGVFGWQRIFVRDGDLPSLPYAVAYNLRRILKEAGWTPVYPIVMPDEVTRLSPATLIVLAKKEFDRLQITTTFALDGGGEGALISYNQVNEDGAGLSRSKE